MKKKIASILALALVVTGGAAVAVAASPPGINGPGLAAVGPVDETTGYPVWYRDKTGLRLEGCVYLNNPLCPARADLPDETAPIVFPDNYPDEGFYSIVEASMDTANGGSALATIALEQAFGAGAVVDGDQVVFARLRLRVRNVTNGVDYKLTTPQGVKTLQANRDGQIFDTEDIGIANNDFTGALGGGVGPFLTWDTFPNDSALVPDATGKATYIGDGSTPHKIKGSPYNTNFFRIEGPGINPAPAVDACPTVSGPFADCIETDLFVVQGKLATNSGVTAEQAIYSRSSASGGTVDVWASSEVGPQSIQVKDTSGTSAFSPTGLGGDEGRYFTRVDFVGSAAPTKVEVANMSDIPVARKSIAVVDAVSGEASYDTASKRLTVDAVSSDTASNRTLTATGFGTLSAGQLVTDEIEAPPVAVTVTSDAGGRATIPVEISGPARDAIPVAAQAGPDQNVVTGQLVQLDASSSRGDVKTYSWESPNGIQLSNPNSATPTFTPSETGTFTFTVTVTGAGGPSSASVTVNVTAPATASANAGPAQTGIQRGTTVTLDGSGSTGAATYAWTQVRAAGDPAATLAGANTAKPTFTFPLYLSPANNGALTFKLAITSPNGTASESTVTVTPKADTVAITSARYTGSKREWRVDGTTSIPAGQRITVHRGSLTGPVLGSAVVDLAGAFSVRVTAAAPTAGTTVSIESALGGTAAGFPVQIR